MEYKKHTITFITEMVKDIPNMEGRSDLIEKAWSVASRILQKEPEELTPLDNLEIAQEALLYMLQELNYTEQ